MLIRDSYLSFYNPDLSFYNPDLSFYNPDLSFYNPDLSFYNSRLVSEISQPKTPGSPRATS